MSSVTNRISRRADGTVTQAGTATEVVVGGVDPRVNDVSICARASRTVIDVATRASASFVGDSSQSPRWSV
jgi:hypothetical protein